MSQNAEQSDPEVIQAPHYEDRSGSSAKMRTIAERLNISIATVSRALRRVPGINAETRARVFAMAAQIGYQLPQSYRAQDLNQAHLQHIVVLIQTPQAQAPAPHYLMGMSDAAMGLNASIVVHYVSPSGCEKLLDPKCQPRVMQAGLGAGIIFVFRWLLEVVTQLAQNFRSVSIMNRYQGVDIDMIGVDNQGGVDLLAGHLVELGHRKIGYLGRCADLHWAAQRFGGYVASLTRLGIEYRPEWVIDMSSTMLTTLHVPTGEIMAQAERLARQQGVTAWICATETVGQQLHAWMTAHGLRVPEDVSVTGFHRSDITDDEGVIALTSVVASYQAMGAAALKRLLYRLQNPAESTRHVLFPFDLFHGQTAGPPAVQRAL